MSQYVMGSRADIAAVVLTAAGLVLAIVLHLLPALFAGLLVHALVHLLAPRMFGFKVDPALARVGVVIVLTLIVLGLTAILVGGATAFYRREGADLASLLQKMADIIDGARTTMPGWMQDIMPTDAETLKDDAAGWLREHAVELRKAGGEVGRGLAYALIGMVIGALLAVREIAPARVPGPLARALQRCALLVEDSFSRVVLAQIRISALNTLLTAIYLVGVLPAFGVHLPLTKTMIALTFVAGLLPIIGNLISNTVIVIISFSYSLPIAAASLAFLVIVHKLEYFINARIVGSRINASAWELLFAMLVMEAAFGLAGVIAAPVFYAYAKAELVARKLV
jgi:predicted PurR-regulated permease PerM